ncbi:MAG: peptidoglycan-binding domain-containing protein [Cyanobacteria bacterium P01_F01_bin.3]
MKKILSRLIKKCSKKYTYEAPAIFTQGDAVSQLQKDINKRLKSLGVSDVISVTVDGWFGNEMMGVVKYLQCVAGLPTDGQMSVRTHAFIINGTSGLETLALGSTGLSVIALKQALASGNHLPISQGDKFCELTRQAVKVYQERMGLWPDGIVGEKTWDKIVRERIGFPCTIWQPNVYIGGSPIAEGSADRFIR